MARHTATHCGECGHTWDERGGDIDNRGHIREGCISRPEHAQGAYCPCRVPHPNKKALARLLLSQDDEHE